MEIGPKLKALRIKRGLTQEELADRCELSKGFISQLERDLTSPSIATLMDVLECLGTNVHDFFRETQDDKIVFGKNDFFEKDDGDSVITWLIPNAQKNDMEPILLRLKPGCATYLDDPHEGEEFGYVLSGAILLEVGSVQKRCGKGESFCFKPSAPHRILNRGKTDARLLWVSTPPSF